MKNEWQTVLEFWFGDENPALQACRPEWFKKDNQFDLKVKNKFLPLLERAVRGAFDAWVEEPKSALALILVLDQFSRNIYRGTSQAFAGDDKALRIVKQVIQRGFDQRLSPLERAFVYLPYEHSESPDDQDTSLRLFSELSKAYPVTVGFYEYAVKHHQVIARFGRFPHRNEILGRKSTEQEMVYLRQPGSRF